MQKKDWGEPKRIGIDEIAQRKGQRNFLTVISDIEEGKPLEIVEGRESQKLIEVLQKKELAAREKVEEVSVDMWEGFGKVIEEVFPNAVIVYDRFHVMQAVNRELNHLRKILKVTTRKAKYLILSNKKELGKEEKEELENILKESPCLEMAHQMKEELREIYEKEKTVSGSRRKLEKWLKQALLFYRDSARMIEKHLEGICNYFLNRTTNGVAEGINTKIKLIKRQGYGFSNFENFKLRILAAFTD